MVLKRAFLSCYIARNCRTLSYSRSYHSSSITTKRLLPPLSLLPEPIMSDLSQSSSPLHHPTTIPPSGQGVEVLTDKNNKRRYIVNRNPSDDSILHERILCADRFEIDDKIANISNYRDETWSNLSLTQRLKYVGEALSHVFNNDENKNGGGKLEILARMISNEMGKTLLESREELSDFQSVRKEMLDLVGKANEPVSLSEDCGVIGRIDREPLGTIAIISPWNYPVLEILLHLVPALVAGNAAIVKPSEVTPMSGAMIVEWLKEWRGVSSDYGVIRLPVEIVQGDGEVGKTLVSHEGVHSVSMTGSSVTGRKIMEECGKSLKRVILEVSESTIF